MNVMNKKNKLCKLSVMMIVILVFYSSCVCDVFTKYAKASSTVQETNSFSSYFPQFPKKFNVAGKYSSKINYQDLSKSSTLLIEGQLNNGSQMLMSFTNQGSSNVIFQLNPGLESKNTITEGANKVTLASLRHYDYNKGSDITYQFGQSETTNLVPTCPLSARSNGVCIAKSLSKVSSSYPFTDVKSGDQSYDAVKWAYQYGVASGTTPTTYSPKNDVNRAQMALFLYRMAGQPSVSLPSTSPFSDVGKNDEFYKAVIWVKNMGISTGESDGLFHPLDPITRIQTSMFLYRVRTNNFENDPNKDKSISFKDVTCRNDIGGCEEVWSVGMMYNHGITTGLSSTEFGVSDRLSRAQMALFLYRFYNNAEKK
ncbi:MAG: S-layer homology domain-containing protein [Candidatus Ancillula sp.]|jgi:hypothetical protein|nr:S-layer homology domain-containing protein [Candidatus Ancillula sp.]